VPYNTLADPITHKLLLGEDVEATSRQTLPLVPEKQIHSNFINTPVNYNKEQSERQKANFLQFKIFPEFSRLQNFIKHF